MKAYIFLLLVITLILSACGEYVSSPRFTQTFYTVNATLKSGNTIWMDNPVWIGKSLSISQLSTMDLFVPDAHVRILQTAPNGDTLSFPLMPWSQTDPESHMSITFYVDPAGHIIQPGHTYRIDIDILDYEKHIYAETTVPPAVQVIPNFNYSPPEGQGFTTDPNDNTTSMPYSQVDVHYPVTIGVNGPQSVYYSVDIYCREPFSTQLEFTNPMFGQTYAPEELEDEYNEAQDGSVRRISIMSKFIPRQHTDGNWYVSLTDYKTAIVFYGRYRFTAQVFDENLYKYKYMIEGYFHGGVHNALGCFGSSSGGLLYT